jgi:hypothetical protein
VPHGTEHVAASTAVPHGAEHAEHISSAASTAAQAATAKAQAAAHTANNAASSVPHAVSQKTTNIVINSQTTHSAHWWSRPYHGFHSGWHSSPSYHYSPSYYDSYDFGYDGGYYDGGYYDHHTVAILFTLVAGAFVWAAVVKPAWEHHCESTTTNTTTINIEETEYDFRNGTETTYESNIKIENEDSDDPDARNGKGTVFV